CEAQTILDPKVAIILILGIGALAISAVGALLGGWFIWFISKGRYNPAIGIAGVSCLPTTAKIAQKEVNHENPYAIILPLAMGAGVSGLIVSAIATGIFISTLFLLN
ncbi:sodium ion-translocating decarboxylase subunit beta, partial [Klebsiella pneumoniae]